MLFKYNDIVAVNDIHNETVGIGYIVDVPLLEGTDEKYSVRFNSGNPIAINRRSIIMLYDPEGNVYEGFANRIRNMIRHIDRGKYMSKQEFKKYRDEWIIKSRGDSLPSRPYSHYAYRYDSKIMDASSMYPVKNSHEDLLKEVDNREVKRLDDAIKKEINNMVNNVNKGFGVAVLAYKKIIFNGPCTIILWKDGSKTIAKLYEDIDKFDPEKGVAICFMKKMMGHTETNKILRKATKQYVEEIAKPNSPTIQETLKNIAEKLSEPLISFNKEDK